MAFGTLDTKYIDLPPGIDQSYIAGLKNRAGVSFATVLSEVDSRLGAANRTIDPLVASLLYVTPEVSVDAFGASAFSVNESSEYTIPRPQLTEGQGVMLPIKGYDVGLQFTQEGLETMSLGRILKNVDSAILGMKRNQYIQTLKRLFSIAEVRVDRSTTVTSPGFAGSGTNYNVFSMPYPDGTALPGGYTHYYRDTTANLAVAVGSALARLKKWQTGPFEMLVNDDALALIVADTTNFVKAGSELLRLASSSAEALVDPSVYVGVYMGEIKVRKALPEIANGSGAYIAIYKSAGSLNPLNPLAWRYDELYGKEMFAVSKALYPLDAAIIKQKFGIGVNNRVSAALIKLSASGNYTDPTIS